MIKKNWILIIILLLSLFLRTWRLDTYPEAIDEDEMSLGYISYSLIHNGTDEYGNKFPIYFKSVGDYKYGLYSYFAAIPISIFGLNTFSTRIMASLFGSLSVLLIYYLALEILNKKHFALISSLVLALNPTHIHFSRIAYNNVMGAFFAVCATLFLIKTLKKYKLKKLLFFFLFFILSIFSYQAYRVILPALIILISLIYIKNTNLIKLLLLNLTCILIVVISFIPAASRARSQNLSILVNSPAIIESSSEDTLAGSKLLTTRIFHNKLLDFSLGLSNRYLSYFDPRFIFLDTNIGVERHSIPGVGLIYLIELPILLVSIFSIFKFGLNKLSWIPLFIIVSAPLGASMVLESRSTTRAIFLVYGLSLLLGFGIYYLSTFKKYFKAILFLLGFLYLSNFLYFFHQYTVHKIYHHPWNSDVGLKEMSKSILEKYINNYDKVVVSKNHYIPFLFYGKTNSLDFINKEGIFSKIIFGMPYDCPPLGQKEVLYVCFGYKVPRTGRVIEVFRYRDGQPAIVLIDFNEKQVSTLPDRIEFDNEVSKLELNGKYWPEN